MRKANAPGCCDVGGDHSVARATPSRPKIPSTSAWASAPLIASSPPQLYSVIEILVPRSYRAIQLFNRGMTSSGPRYDCHDSSVYVGSHSDRVDRSRMAWVVADPAGLRATPSFWG